MSQLVKKNRAVIVKYAIMFVGVMASNRLSNDLAAAFERATR